MSKKSLITAVSTAAMVATLGFAYAQSSDEGAYPNANINGPVDNSVPKHWAHDSVTDNNPYETAAPTAAGPSTTMPADTTTSAAAPSTATPPSTDANSPWAADTTSTPPASTSTAPASSYDTTSGTTPATTTDAVNQSNGSLSTNAAPTESHVDLNSPNDPIYNMGKDSSAERTPRPDRN